AGTPGGAPDRAQRRLGGVRHRSPVSSAAGLRDPDSGARRHRLRTPARRVPRQRAHRADGRAATSVDHPLLPGSGAALSRPYTPPDGEQRAATTSTIGRISTARIYLPTHRFRQGLHMHDYVNWLRHATPYINAHRERTFVVMLPGDGVAHGNFANIVHDLVLLHSLGVRLVLVHGSRPQIEARLAARGLVPRYQNDLRITDGATLECVIDAVGQLRIAIEAAMSMDMAASPMQGSRLRVSSGNFVTA